MAVDIVEDKRVSVTVPEGAIITVVADPGDRSRVDISWEGRKYVMLVIELADAGTEIEQH